MKKKICFGNLLLRFAATVSSGIFKKYSCGQILSSLKDDLSANFLVKFYKYFN